MCAKKKLIKLFILIIGLQGQVFAGKSKKICLTVPLVNKKVEPGKDLYLEVFDMRQCQKDLKFKRVYFDYSELCTLGVCINNEWKSNQEPINKLFRLYGEYCANEMSKQLFQKWKCQFLASFLMLDVPIELKVINDFTIRLFYQLLDSILVYDASKGLYTRVSGYFLPKDIKS